MKSECSPPDVSAGRCWRTAAANADVDDDVLADDDAVDDDDDDDDE